MTDDRRMTTDRFFGGVSGRLANLRAMLEYVRKEQPQRDELVRWLIDNTNATSKDAVNHHLAFVDSIDLIEIGESTCTLGRFGDEWLADEDPEVLFEALTTGVKGFLTILGALEQTPLTDEGIMNLLVNEFDEAEMSQPGPATRHREWLQVLGYVERDGNTNQITEAGREAIHSEFSATPSYRFPPSGVSIGDRLAQDEIEEVFDTGFGYRISGINPRRDETDQRYILVFATEDGPYDDSVRRGRFEYIGEGLTGDQSETSSGNSALIDAISDDIPIHFFYQESGEHTWEYQGLVDAVEYRAEQQDGRRVLVFTLEHTTEGQRLDEDTSSTDISAERQVLERALKADPPRQDVEQTYVETQRLARDAAFTDLVREAYDGTCAICGRARETPGGKPEVEAAHIYPKGEAGVDDVRNGLAVCRLHHWAFDAGWIAIDDDYEVIVYDASHREGYEEFKALEGQSLHLPDNEDAEPHRMYLEMHRELHGF